MNLCVTEMPPIKFQLNRTYGLGGDVVRRISTWSPGRPSWISEWNDFSNSDFHVATMPPTKFQLNPTYGSGDVENVKS